MANEEARWEEEHNFRKVFYNMVGKVDKLFVEYEKELGHEKKDADDHGSENLEGGGADPPPSPSSSDISHHSQRNSKNTSKKPFFKLDVNFDLPMYNGECSAEKLNNWIRQIEVYSESNRFKKMR